ncbi:diphosphomevalonate decarboxylase [Cuniculiplasma sp. SKW3]|uniref:mevalonate-3-kinase n=1 Tax=Cuniculiplasma sp. SKW3 TaxID=3400170 RepID=UPI003FD51A2D
MSLWKVQAVAHPTIGIVLFGGIKDMYERLPYHSSAGIAYTLVDSESVARTTLTVGADKSYVSINGEEINSEDSRSPMKLIKSYSDQFIQRYGTDKISIESVNENILSGSSDAGAAALGKCVNSLLEVDSISLELEMRKVSESAGRSYYGGLTVTYADEKPYTKRILDKDAFENIRIVSAVFPHKRKPSDDIHTNQPKHEHYKVRIKNAEAAVKRLESLSEIRDVKGIFELAMEDTEDYHYMNSLVNVEIVTPEMRKLMDDIIEWRSDLWMTYIVTGGNSVFIPTLSENVSEVKKRALKHTNEIHELKVTGGAKTVFSQSS